MNANDKDGLLNVEAQLNKIKHLKKGVYEDYRSGLLTRDEFIEYKADYDKQEQNIEKLIQDMTNKNMSEEEAIIESDFVKSLKNTKRIEVLDRIILESFYDKIYIYEDKKIKFKYKFQEIVDGILEV